MRSMVCSFLFFSMLCLVGQDNAEESIIESMVFETPNVRNSTELCDSISVQASYDFKKGNKKIVLFGLRTGSDHIFDKFYRDYLKRRFDLEFSYGGCLVSVNEQCYSNSILNLLNIEYGYQGNFLDETKREALNLYRKRKSLIQWYYDPSFDGIYLSPDKSPVFPGGSDILKQHLRKALLSEGVDPDSLIAIYTRVVIEADGSLTSVQMLRKINDEIDGKVEQVLLQSPKWTPGILNGEEVPVRMVLPLKFW